MADGINIKTLPAATTVAGSDRILIDKNVIGTQVIPFSAVIVNGSQVTFYTDFINLSAYTYALSASTNAVFAQVETNIVSVSTNSITNSANIVQLRTDLNSVSSDVVAISANTLSIRTDVNLVSANVSLLSSNTTTFISGGISPSGSIVPAKVGILYFAANTKDYFVSVDNVTNKDWKQILTLGY
jgi:hypothetical protein